MRISQEVERLACIPVFDSELKKKYYFHDAVNNKHGALHTRQSLSCKKYFADMDRVIHMKPTTRLEL
jgi:hypothetical protein